MFPKQIHIYVLHLNRTVHWVERLQERQIRFGDQSACQLSRILLVHNLLFSQQEALAGKQWPDELPGWAVVIGIIDTILFTQFFLFSL